MSAAIDKNKLKELIQKTPTKDLLYLNVNSVDKNSLKSVLSQIEKFVGKDGGELVVIQT